jgi:glycosyltransferase involved in cell wall biosynthesis/peptidoglycan/xylan/chitin deacetylase (PgdA/CDA1 family)/ubiquinone/menaquinone biosynthesis C-methylase UbiE
MIEISVIIPAFNGGTTITQTIESLLSQTYSAWEAIVVDDGSNDNTVEIVNAFVEKDNRIRIISQPNQGVSVARNTGIGLAKYDWLLFLDSDDWIGKGHLERMTHTLSSNSNIDAVICGWCSVAPDGTHSNPTFAPQERDMFPLLAQYCAFVIHACIIRKSLVKLVGGFDLDLSVCEDWDMWQKIARTGAYFGTVNEVHAYYNMRHNSVSRNAELFFESALKVLNRGYTYDSRVVNPYPGYINGLHPQQLSNQKYYWASWCAGLHIAQNKDAGHLLKLFADEHPFNLDSQWIANNIFDSICRAACLLPDAWHKVWFKVKDRIKEFLLALESKSQNEGLAIRVLYNLERKIFEFGSLSETDSPLSFGSMYVIPLEVTTPITDIFPPSTAERLYCVVKMEGTLLGTIELPICDESVPAWLLKDAITAQFAWQILGRFFELTVYIKNGVTPAQEEESPQAMHDRIGWDAFLQQLWEETKVFDNHTYISNLVRKLQRKKLHTPLLIVEVSKSLPDILPDIKIEAKTLNVIFTAGGVTVGVVQLPIADTLIRAKDLQAAINDKGGFELCRICVREALIGRPFTEPTPLRKRLAQAAKRRSVINAPFLSNDIHGFYGEEMLTPNTLVLGQRSNLVGITSSRRAILPIEVADELVEMAKFTGELILQVPLPGNKPDRILYMPEVIAALPDKPYTPANQWDQANNVNLYDRRHFETLFTKSPDPWKYTHPYEQTKYELTLSLLPDLKFNKALEIACAEGHFTLQLAPKVTSLVAADISKIALERASQRCSHLKNITYQHLDIIKDPLPGQFDLIVCSEVLYYVGGKDELISVSNRFAQALLPNGFLLMAHAHQVIDEPESPGFDWGLTFGARVISEVFSTNPSLQLIKEMRTPLYRIQLFQHKVNSVPSIEPTIQFVEQPTPVPPAVEASVRWKGGKPADDVVLNEKVVTGELPILMYHRIAPTGANNMTRYCVTPDSFEEQLRYLRDSGYYSVKWDDWLNAIITRRPLPGRAIALTFDDGYLDFYQYAWPLLKKYGFTATVFLVTGQIGHTNVWDEAYGEIIPLMGWEEIEKLSQEGIEFGSHSVSHKHLTTLSAIDIVREGAQSRTILNRALQVNIRTFAYPYGDTDPVVAHLIGACGYMLGFSCQSGLSSLYENSMNLSRIEVMGSYNLQEFITKLANL